MKLFGPNPKKSKITPLTDLAWLYQVFGKTAQVTAQVSQVLSALPLREELLELGPQGPDVSTHAEEVLGSGVAHGRCSRTALTGMRL